MLINGAFLAVWAGFSCGKQARQSEKARVLGAPEIVFSASGAQYRWTSEIVTINPGKGETTCT
jgi:hypothetical protein